MTPAVVRGVGLNLFISHSSRDSELANLVQGYAETLLLGAVRCFNTSGMGTITPGEQWLTRIVTTLRETNVLLALLTPAGLRSSYVHFEAGAAWIQEGGVVIPCTAGQVKKGELPSPYDQLQGIDLTDPRDLKVLFADLSSRANLHAPSFDADAMAVEIAEAVQVASSDPEGVAPDGAVLGNYIERSIELEWRYHRSGSDPRQWAASYLQRLDLEVTGPELRNITMDFSPAVQVHSFSDENPPVVTLADGIRSSDGNVRCAAPHQHSGSKFAFRIHFDPPLRRGERARLEVHIDFPDYKSGILEDFIGAQLAAGGEVRTYDFNSRIISRLNDLFTYRVFLPLELGAKPLDPEVLRHGHEFPEEQAYVRDHPEIFTVHQVEINGELAWRIELRRERPPFRANYRLRWEPPRVADLPSGIFGGEGSANLSCL